MWGTFGFVGIIICVVLYYIIKLAVEDGVFNALVKYNKLKEKESIGTIEDETDFKNIKH